MKFAYFALILSLVVAVAGCQTGGKAPSDTELIQRDIKAATDAALAQDIDKFLTFFSEDFSCQFGDKEGFREFLMNAKENKFLDDMTVDTSAAKVTVDGDKAEVAPVTISGTFGNPEISFSLAKEKAGWKITGMDVQG